MGPPKFKDISYVHGYTTQDHEITMHQTNFSLFPILIANGCPEIWEDNARTMKQRSGEILAWYETANVGIDLHIEIEHTVDVNNLAAKYPKKWVWTREGPKQDGGELSIYSFTSTLCDRGVLYHPTNWNTYLRDQVGGSLELIQNVAKVLRKPIAIPKQYLALYYIAETKLVAFLEGTIRRYDYKYLKKFLASATDFECRLYKPNTWDEHLPLHFFDEHAKMVNALHPQASKALKLLDNRQCRHKKFC